MIELAPKGPDFLFLCHFCFYISNSSHLRDAEIAERKNKKSYPFRVITLYFSKILSIFVYFHFFLSVIMSLETMA